MRKLLIYNPIPSSRSDYVFRFIFDDVLEWTWSETGDADVFSASRDIRISYAEKMVPDSFHIPSSGFLSEQGIRSFEPGCVFDGEMPHLFPSEESGSLPFDLFSAVFFMISRYEEYHPEKTDMHGRMIPSETLAFRKGFSDRPVVDEWIYSFAAALKKQYSDVILPARTFRFQPTIDIDNAYAFRHKGLLRSVGGYFRALINADFSEIAFRTRVLAGNRKDPYDTYHFIKNIHRQYSLAPTLFILGGKYARYDKNISVHNRHFRKLVIELGAVGEVGLHPSYLASLNGKIKTEKRQLEKNSGKTIRHSRQHFLMLRFPDTYRTLIEAGIENDYSMGYSTQNGFRAGTCTPFYFYDITEEKRRDLLIHPFQVIDVSFQHSGMSPHQATEQIETIIDRIQKVNGVFVSVWHNESLGNYKKWAGWKEVYQRMIKLAVQKTDPYE